MKKVLKRISFFLKELLNIVTDVLVPTCGFNRGNSSITTCTFKMEYMQLKKLRIGCTTLKELVTRLKKKSTRLKKTLRNKLTRAMRQVLLEGLAAFVLIP